jgi:hypothetical protein
MNPNVSSLPDTFQVIATPDGSILHELTDTSDPNAHCAGFHGSASVGNTHYLACDADHGGIVVVEYDPATETYTSKAIMYPDEFDGYRIGSFAYHYTANAVVGSMTLDGGTDFYLVAVPNGATAIGEENILMLPGDLRECGYQFEVGSGHDLLVFMPNGFLHAFEVTPEGTFVEIMQKEIVPGMTACSEAAFVAGIGQAFIATPATQTLYAVDLTHMEEGEADIFTTDLPFFPSVMTVSGFELEYACEGGHDHDGDKTEEPSVAASSTGLLAAVVGSSLAAVVAAFMI